MEKRTGALSARMIDALIPHECPREKGKACYACVRKRDEEQARETRRRFDLDILRYWS